MMRSPAGVTSRLDRLEAAGWISRRHDQADRRSFIVGLTDAGFDVIDRAVTQHVDNEERLLAVLSERDRSGLDRVLDRLLASLSADDLA